MEQQTSEIILFFGRFHPLALHLPIGFLLMAFLLEILSRFKRFANYKPAVGFTLLLGAISAIIVAVLGLMLASGGGYGEELLNLHQWLGIGAVIAAVASFFLHRTLQKKPSQILDKIYMSVLSVMIVVLMAAGHFGGSLTHGSDYLTHYMPNPVRTVVGLEPRKESEMVKITNLPEARVYEDIIYPILDARCISCHNPEKRKGELDMSSMKAIMKGGENGTLFEVGSPMESHIIKVIRLPEKDEDHMPPDGKNQLSDEQIELLSWWIKQGAPFDKRVAEVDVNEEMQKILDALIDPNANKTEVEILLASGVIEVEKGLLSQIRAKGIEVSPLAAKVNWLQARIPKKQSGDSLVQALRPIAEQLTWLDMGGGSTTDVALKVFSQFTNLTRVHLEKTQVTDAGMQHLMDLDYLQYLNLYGTNVSDEGIMHLKALKNLRELTLFQTKVTLEGVAKLQEALPQLQINMGIKYNREKKSSIDSSGTAIGAVNRNK